jgi:hypothetical protein
MSDCKAKVNREQRNCKSNSKAIAKLQSDCKAIAKRLQSEIEKRLQNYGSVIENKIK